MSIQLSIETTDVAALLELPEIVAAHLADRQKAFDKSTARRASLGRKLDVAKHLQVLVDSLVEQIPEEIKQLAAEPPAWLSRGMCFLAGPGGLPVAFQLDKNSGTWKGMGLDADGNLAILTKTVSELVDEGAVASPDEVVVPEVDETPVSTEVDLASYEPEDPDDPAAFSLTTPADEV